MPRGLGEVGEDGEERDREGDDGRGGAQVLVLPEEIHQRRGVPRRAVCLRVADMLPVRGEGGVPAPVSEAAAQSVALAHRTSGGEREAEPATHPSRTQVQVRSQPETGPENKKKKSLMKFDQNRQSTNFDLICLKFLNSAHIKIVCQL